MEARWRERWSFGQCRAHALRHFSMACQVTTLNPLHTHSTCYIQDESEGCCISWHVPASPWSGRGSQQHSGQTLVVRSRIALPPPHMPRLCYSAGTDGRGRAGSYEWYTSKDAECLSKVPGCALVSMTTCQHRMRSPFGPTLIMIYPSHAGQIIPTSIAWRVG